MPDVLAAARALWRAGLSVIPVCRDGSKRPAVPWKRWQSERAGDLLLCEWFNPPNGFAVGVVCGAVSGNLIVFDFEDARACDRWVSAVNEKWPAVLEGCPVAQTPRGGRHVYLRSNAPVPAGAKTAFWPDGHDGVRLVGETRGEGHYVICPGSPSDVHETGNPYLWLRGGWIGV